MCNCCGTEEIAEAENEEPTVADKPKLKVRQMIAFRKKTPDQFGRLE
jgi:hypothetical protein